MLFDLNIGTPYSLNSLGLNEIPFQDKTMSFNLTHSQLLGISNGISF